MSGHARDRFRPLHMLRALSRLLRNPQDTTQVFEVISAFGTTALRHKITTLQGKASGRALLDERPSLAAKLVGTKPEDFAPGTLGREYHEFLAREGITTEGLMQISRISHDTLEGDTRYLANRMVHQHDLWHVLTGYQGDLIGEACLLAFTTRHSRNPATAVMVAAFYLVAGRQLPARAMIRDAYRRAGQLDEMVTARLESLLHTPLPQARRELGLDEPPAYTPVRAEQLGRWGVLGPVAAAR